MTDTNKERAEFEAWYFDEFDALDFARAVLAKWGTPAPVWVEPTEEPSLCNDPRLCCRSHPHDKQDLHCQLREVAAWLRWHTAVGKTPSAESMNTHAEQVDAVALALRAAPVVVEPVARLEIGKTKGGVSLTHIAEPAAYQLQECTYALYTAPQPVAREPQCWCLTCRPMRFEDPYSIRMALCPTCGNKRCPKANDHRNTCTGSNEPGQPGSAYFGGIKGGQHGAE